MKPQTYFQRILVVGTATLMLLAFKVPPLVQGEDHDFKLNSQFLDAIRKGDIKKMNALAERGATVNPRGMPLEDFEVVQIVAGGCSFDYKATSLTGASPTMLAAIESAQPESVRALLALGFDPKPWFYEGGIPITPVDPASLYLAARLGEVMSVQYGNFTLHVGPDTNGHVVCYPCPVPVPVTKVTYLSVAEQALAVSRNSKRQQKLQLIVDLLTQAGGRQ